MPKESRNMIKIGNLTLYSIRELSEILGVTNTTLRAYLREGRIFGQKVGGSWYVSEESLQEFFRRPEKKRSVK